MDLGAVTLIVAVTFSAIGIVAGILISKFLSGGEQPQPDLTEVKERVEGISDRITLLVDELKEKLKKLQSERIEEIRRDVDDLLSEIERLKSSLHKLDLSEDSISALDRAEKLLQEVEFRLPKIDESLLTQVKDSLLILRNDVETLLSRNRESQTQESPSPNIDLSAIESVITSLDSAIALSKRLNALLLKGELTALADSFKNEEIASLVRELDDQALNSKEIVVLLEDVRKKLEEVRDEASLRR